MTIRNLDAAFTPKSVAVVGASPRPGAVGRVVFENIINGGYAGTIYPVNLKYDDVLGRHCFRRVADLPEAPDLAIVMTPPETVPGLIAELGAKGCRLAVVITAGLGAMNGLRQQLLDAAGLHLLRVIGPNTIGLLAPHARLNASFVHLSPVPGTLGLISQSGAIVSSVIDWAAAEGIGFSSALSLGDMADVDMGDALNMLAADEHTHAILLYLESIPAPRKFMSAARAAARIKPVIAIKPGRHAEAAKAALTHTGALAGADRVVDAALRRAGVIRVDDLDDLFNAAEITARYPPLRQGRVAIVTNGGGAGVLAVDQLLDQGCVLATLMPETLAALDAALPATWSHANPVDIIGDAPPERYRAAVEAVAADPGVDAILVMNCPTAVADPVAAAAGLAGLVTQGCLNGKPVLACWLGKKAAEPARAVLQQAGIGSFETPAQAAEAVALLTRWSDLRQTLERVPASHAEFAVDFPQAQAIIKAAAFDGRTVLTEWEAKSVLRAYGIPAPETVVATTEDEVAEAATRLLAASPALVVKMLSKAVSHKSDIGGVVLDTVSASAARSAAADIRRRFAEHYPAIPLDGFTVQPMIKRPHAVELIAGISTDPIFGPVALFGAGGTAVEVVDDTATGLVPLDAVLAGDLIDRTRISRLLAGYRDRKPADRSAIVNVLLGLSQLAIDFPALRSVDINPLLADTDGVVALDARIEIDPKLAEQPGPNPSLAIRPYPAGLAKTVETGGLHLLMRPIRPEDAALYPRFLERMDPEDMRMRFLMPMRTISHEMLVRLTQLDYDRDIAFVALDQPSGDLVGIARYSADPDSERAEFGILVRSDLKSRGAGWLLMEQLIAYARSEQIGRLEGLVLMENEPMLKFCRELGFSVDQLPAESGLVRATLHLGADGAAAPRSGS
ncbi:MAG: bifunctional acetate--CoA ligase family protein/GNAT family N-acetyltransferase [Devosia nanyangense]|uniref:Bifunctional acetate--CoA ligase family protein/GNAT family N-acetyltransferase n=1 Tax=Devosia nanyangense TaxID=1228055 RepID=A0A933L6N9_9HYPH|nr:bifunctional acetate--CoA ligase family protein/GNAT family N-acetyltransferase [Devosia nanyangense]